MNEYFLFLVGFFAGIAFGVGWVLGRMIDDISKGQLKFVIRKRGGAGK